MHGKVVVITGATSGIGEVAAERLAALGARIVLIGRDPKRAEATLARLRQAGPGVVHSAHYADLSRLGEMRRVAADVAEAEPRIDVLVNNAGALFNTRILTPDGLEMTFATNHMAYFVLTLGLRRSLLAAAPSRIVSTASMAHRGNRLYFDDLQSAKSYRGFTAYGRSKLCNILFTRALARRIEGMGVTANCLHPGFVATRFGDASGGLLGRAFGLFKLFAISPERGARTIVYLASSPEVAGSNGLYFVESKPATPSAQAQDDTAAERLWIESARDRRIVVDRLCGGRRISEDRRARSMTDEGRCRSQAANAQQRPSSARRCRAPSPRASGRRARPSIAATRLAPSV